MKRAWIEASRAEEVRDAARGWADAGAIDAATLAAIERAYPDFRAELHPAWRILTFILATVALGALFVGIFHDLSRLHEFLWPSAIYALALATATEWLRGSKISGTGADAATSFLSLVFLIVAVVIRLDAPGFDSEFIFTAVLVVLALASALAAWRWGFWFWAGTAAAAGFLAAGRISGARPIWIALSLLLIVLTFGRLDRPSLAPAHRRCLAAVLAVASAAFYAAINLYLADSRFPERLEKLDALLRAWGDLPAPAASLRFAYALATAAFPLFFLLWGIRTRRRLLLGIAIASGVFSVMTWRHYVPIGPRWAYLTACGASLIAVALWAHRRLRAAAGSGWRGLTAWPLYSSGSDAHLTPLGALGAQLVVPAAPAQPHRGDLSAGGGSFGGGGASGDY